jgi:molecular chaperone DnaJ
MARNCYVVLGVSRDADLSQIRRAYRRLVQRCHPDVGGAAGRFQEVRQAYETLRDEASRREHDAALGPPLRSTAAARGGPVEERLFSGADDFFGGWIPGFFNAGRMASRRKDLYVELILSPEEATTGGLFTLDVPVCETCPRCGGTGWHGMLACPTCRGRSVRYPEVQLSVPPHVSDGTRVRLSLEDVGLRDVILNVLVSVRR